MKKLIPVLILAILGCCTSAVRLISGDPTQTPTAALPPVPTQTPLAPPELGTEQNPLILALGPSPHPSPDAIAAGEVIAAFIESRTGYRLVTVAPPSESVLVEAVRKGNAHILPLTPFGYLLARENNSVMVVLSSLRDGQAFYGAQFIANRESEFTSYYNAGRAENTAEALEALRQFEDKKPCWSDETSPSGYVVPLGYLNKNQIQTRLAAFVQGHPTVVRSVYAGGICDFGATYIDARKFPSLEDQYPDLMEQVIIVWQTPEIIPYSVFAFSTNMSNQYVIFLRISFLPLCKQMTVKSPLKLPLISMGRTTW